jgi:hypothetical protein
VLTKTANLANDQSRYFNLPAENTTDFYGISTDDMDHQSVNDETHEIYQLS